MAVEFNQISMNTEVIKSEIECLKDIERRIGLLVVRVFEHNESDKVAELGEDLEKMKKVYRSIAAFSRETELLFQSYFPSTEQELNKLMKVREGFDGLLIKENRIKEHHDIDGISEALTGMQLKAVVEIRERLEEISRSIAASENLEIRINELKDLQEIIQTNPLISERVKNEELTPAVEREIKRGMEMLEAAAADALREYPSLNSLTEDEMLATGGRSEFYSKEFKDLCPEYHRTGDAWSDEVAGNFFRKGLFQHYIAMKCDRYNCNLDYVEAFNPQKKHLGFNERIVAHTLLGWQGVITREKKIHDLMELRKIIERFSLQPQLLRMGAQFQREKVLLEKMEPEVRRGNEAAFREMMKLDGICTNRQKVLFHWISDFSEKLIAFVRSKNEMGDVVIDSDEFELSMPEFFENPEYARFLES